MIPQVTLVYNRRKTASTKRKAVVEIRITYNSKQKYISTGIMLYPNQWKKNLVTNTPDAVQLNNTISLLLKEVREVILDMVDKNTIDIFSIPLKVQEKRNSNITFIDFCKQRAAIRKYGKSKDSQERYDRFIRLFLLWGKIKDFEEVTDHNIILMDEYLTSKGMKPYSKWNNYHRFLNSFILDAMNEGLLKRNPYKWINIQKHKDSKSIERCLDFEEVKKIIESPMPTPCIEKVRDLFVFQTYTCLSYSDLRNFDVNAIQDIKGMKVYTGNRRKTAIPFTIPLLPPALDILSKYNYKLPIISNVKYNEYLKIVAQSSGIDKPVSSHWARHTGATLLLNEGISMNIISKICGHSSTKITEQIYAKLLDETIVEAIKDIKI